MIVGVFRDRMPRISLSLQGGGGTFAVEFVLDTGFQGFLSLPRSILNRLGSAPVGNQVTRLADGSLDIVPDHRVFVDWDGELREMEAIAYENNSLLGMMAVEGCHIDMEAWEVGEVLIELPD